LLVKLKKIKNKQINSPKIKKSFLINKYFFFIKIRYIKKKENNTTMKSAINIEKTKEKGIRKIKKLINKLKVTDLS
tara:strand:- start:1139 stop:1366 length:228 start_codon:yes stop_codon:yes gene_type:complete